MHDCTVTAKPGSSDLTAVVVGHSAAKLPRLVETEAARIAKGTANEAIRLYYEATGLWKCAAETEIAK